MTIPTPDTQTPDTYLQHINAAQDALAQLPAHANQHLLAAVAQAHALTAIALLLEDVLGSLDQQTQPEMYNTVRIIGGFGSHTAH